MPSLRLVPLGSCESKTSGAWVTAYLFDGAPRAEVNAAGAFTLAECRELRAMLDATIKRLETSCKG